MEITFNEARQHLDQWQRDETIVSACMSTMDNTVILRGEYRVNQVGERLILVDHAHPKLAMIDVDCAGRWQLNKPSEFSDTPHHYPGKVGDPAFLVLSCGLWAGLSLIPQAELLKDGAATLQVN